MIDNGGSDDGCGSGGGEGGVIKSGDRGGAGAG